jgi:hypothetical protein
VRYLFTTVVLLSLGAVAQAASFKFLSDPFAGTDVLTTPGRQIVGGEPFIEFTVAADEFVLSRTNLGGRGIVFANALVSDIADDANVVVLQTLDNDANPATPFGAGAAANLIAGVVETSAPGYFIYFNSGLNLPRLVFSADLSDPTADLKIVARMTNFLGDPGVMPTFTEENFRLTPEPGTMFPLASGLALTALFYRRFRLRR